MKGWHFIEEDLADVKDELGKDTLPWIDWAAFRSWVAVWPLEVPREAGA